MITDSLNKRLRVLFGHDLMGRSHFRVVWSDSQIEKRMGTVSEYYHNLYLRERFGVMTVPKYQGVARNRWVLERLTWIPRELNREFVPLSDDGASYEPVYVYSAPHGEAELPPMEAVVFTIHCFRNPQHYTPSDYEDMDREEGEKEEADIYDELTDDLPDMAHSLHEGHAVSYSSMDAQRAFSEKGT